MLDVTILTPQEILFQGKASRVILPGEMGTFEVGQFHRPIVSRLFPGLLIVDDKSVPVLRGVVKVEQDRVTSIVELE
ncbi:MAG: hypothetical protein HYZ94_02690 [Candidatus Omnitrophica bacterium]|nr:hypothetical protein [Candidatus Omnitrophota bacterium]